MVTPYDQNLQIDTGAYRAVHPLGTKFLLGKRGLPIALRVAELSAQ